MKNTINAILLKGKGTSEEIIELSKDNILEDIYDYLEIKDGLDFNCHTFGDGYIAIWNENIKTNTCMEITCYAGASFPIFIDSNVIILKEDKSAYVDIDINKVKKYFNTENAFWALIKQ